MNPLLTQQQLMPGELPLIMGAPNTWIWRPHHGWVPHPEGRTSVPLTRLSGRGSVRRWVAQRMKKAPELPFQTVLVLVTREVHPDYVSFGMFLTRYMNEKLRVSDELGQHLVDPKVLRAGVK